MTNKTIYTSEFLKEIISLRKDVDELQNEIFWMKQDIQKMNRKQINENFDQIEDKINEIVYSFSGIHRIDIKKV